MKKRLLFAMCIATTAIIMTACAAESKANESEPDAVEILFRDYGWGTSEDDVVAGEIKDEMKEYQDYLIDEEEGFSCLTLKNVSVGGCTADAGYMFVNGVLEAGGYDVDMSEQSSYEEIVDKYTEKYGTPFLTKESTGWGPCAMWVDDDMNFVFISSTMGIVYVEGGSSAVDLFADQISKFHEVDIELELGKVGNVDGI